MKKALRQLEIGNSVAEHDESLEKYFVENEAFRALVQGKVDVVAGDKGTGKTALYRILQKRYRHFKELSGVEILAGFNPVGNPVFQRLVQQDTLTEGQYTSVWKTYILSLVGNWTLEMLGADHSPSFEQLDELLRGAGLRSADDKPQTIFGRIVNAIQKALSVKSASVEVKLSETGIPIITPTVHFGSPETASEPPEVRHEDALRLLNDCLCELGFSIWVVLDRLDEAFQGFPQVEIPALRALFRTYLDLQEFDKLRLKLFVRRDLFRRIIGKGFVNLTHINARKIEIVWEDEDLLNLLCQRVRENQQLLLDLGATDLSNEDLFSRIFPHKVDTGEKKPTTWNWLLSRIRDGNGIRPPRNLIDLVVMAREAQLRVESRSPREYSADKPLLEPDSLKSAHRRLSAQRIEDTLLAESDQEVSSLIERFRRSKAEHSRETIQSTLELDENDLSTAIQQLVEIGFFEELRSTWKIPMLYRDGLDITQGKAF